MDVTDIIKESFIFPSKNIGNLVIYIVLSVIFIVLIGVAIAFFCIGLIDSSALIGVSAILFIISFVLGFILSGYIVSIIKSGIYMEESAPNMEWKENLMSGIKYFVVSVVYYIIPTIIVLIIAFITNLPGIIKEIISQSYADYIAVNTTINATTPAVNTISDSLMSNFLVSLTIVSIVALILFIIFLFIKTIASARLANTDDLSEALNIVESFKDIGRIGWGKFVASVMIFIIINIIINVLISIIEIYVPAISIVSIVIIPYLLFFFARVIGLLYSDIT